MRHPVYLVRHGQSRWNVLRLTQGQTAHPPLTALGREQARSAAERIAADLADGSGSAGGRLPARLVTSDLTRAVQTAQIIAARMQLRVEVDQRWREQHLGRLQGRSYEHTWAAAEQVDWSDPHAPIHGGESLMQVRERVTEAFEQLDPTGVSIVVSHGDSIRAVIAHLHGLRPTDAPWVEVGNGAVARYDGRLRWLDDPAVGAPLPDEPTAG